MKEMRTNTFHMFVGVVVVRHSKLYLTLYSGDLSLALSLSLSLVSRNLWRF